jgi:hypothetical protein
MRFLLHRLDMSSVFCLVFHIVFTRTSADAISAIIYTI